MALYVVTEDTNFSGQSISENHFGVNLITIYDEEFVDPENELAENVQQLGASTLRFPGGAATEYYFDMRQPDLAVSARDPAQTLTPMDQFFMRAGEIGTSVTIVIPTQMAFASSAAEAMLAGTYGGREEVTSEYLQDVATFVATAIAYAQVSGAGIKAFEIGNEFWGSGEMTAGEYGIVAGEVAALVASELDALGISETEIIAQTTSSASQLYSSRDAVEAFVGTVDGVLRAYTQSDVDREFGGQVPDDWQSVLVDGQGAAREQVSRIAEGINSVPEAAMALDGLVQHYYQSGGFETADGTKSFKFSQFGRLEGQLNRGADSPDMTYHITEWNTNATGAADNRGLKNASMMIENFFELVANDVDSAQIWPLSFDQAQGVSLVDLDGTDLAISGEMFRLMSESLSDSTPILDWSVAGIIDVHGFSKGTGAVFFVSERSGARQTNVELDVSQFLNGQSYFISMTQLWDGGAGGEDASAEPVLTDTVGMMAQSGPISFDLDSWANLRVEVTFVGDGHDTITGRGGADTIDSFDGNDQIRAGDGDDTINAGAGDDEIWGDAGADFIFAGAGADVIDGGEGIDTAAFSGALEDYSVAHDPGSDWQNGFTVTGPAGESDFLRNIEKLSFSDQEISVQELFDGRQNPASSDPPQDGAAPPQGVEDNPVPSSALMEVGRTSIEQLGADYWQAVTFSEEIADAVVIMGPASSQGGQPFSMRVRNVTETGFEFQLDEWDYLDGYHAEIEVSWLAGTRGEHQLADGTDISFGTLELTGLEPETAVLGGFDSAPMVFGQVAGDAESGALIHRIDEVSAEAFSVKLQMEEASTATSSDLAPSTFYFAALDVAEDSFVFDHGSHDIKNRYKGIGEKLSDTEGFFADMQSIGGQDPGVVRYMEARNGDISLRVQEERSHDHETKHGDEDVAWFFVEQGVYDFV